MPKKVAIHSLGCKLNFAEGTEILKQFELQDFQTVGFREKADIYIINTCAVTQIADSKSRHFIRQSINNNPNAIIVVTGCYAQISIEDINKIQGVDYIVGNGDKKHFFSRADRLIKQEKPKVYVSDIEISDEFHTSFSLHERTRSFLKVQDGCNYNCNYCTIPFTRGPSRNPSIQTIVNEANEIATHNIKEIILTGINIGDFGHSTKENFFDLIKALDDVQGIERYRISSIEPNLLTFEMIEWIAQSKHFAHHFHIPLQSGSDAILRQMKRRYNTKLFKDKIEAIHQMMPNAGIGIDIITGYPSEAENDFENTFQFVSDLPVSYFHVFSYSERPLAQSKKLEQLNDRQTINNRSKKLHLLGDRKKRFFIEKNIGKSSYVLFENDKKQDKIWGLTDNYIRIEHPFLEHLKNQFVNVNLQPSNNPFILKTQIL